MAKIYVSEHDSQPYYEMYMSELNLVSWAQKLVRGREEYAANQLSRLRGAIRAYREGARPAPPGLGVEGIAALILFSAGDPEVIVEGLSRRDVTVLPLKGKLVVHVGEGKKWVYRFSPPSPSTKAKAEAPTEASLGASVGARARVKRAR